MELLVGLTGWLFFLSPLALLAAVILGALAISEEGWRGALGGTRPRELVSLFAFSPLILVLTLVSFVAKSEAGMAQASWMRVIVTVLVWANVSVGIALVWRRPERWRLPAAAAVVSSSMSVAGWFVATVLLSDGPGIGGRAAAAGRPARATTQSGRPRRAA
ncbi:MAG TPA: hypothetical protein VFZ11_13070, partial [Gemmatimonadaceae bacterium]